MDKLLKSSIALFLFASSLAIFEMCSKENAIAQAASYILPIATPSVLGGVKPDGTSVLVDAAGKISTNAIQQQNKILFSTQPPVVGGVVSGTYKIFIANFDGTNVTEVPLTGLDYSSSFEIVDAKISPDGQTIFIIVANLNSNTSEIYTMSSTGTNLKKIFSSPFSFGQLYFNSVYPY